MNLKGVTICGADEGVVVSSLNAMSERFPFVEWGILVGSHPGTPRYPTMVWIHELCQQIEGRLSLHVCGKWLRDIASGEFTFANQYPQFMGSFSRVQLNFRSAGHPGHEEVGRALRPFRFRHQFIFQMDGKNDGLFGILRHQLAAVPLFDRSCGSGTVPDSYATGQTGTLCGYAGGIRPSNVVQQLENISIAAGAADFWIDIESGVRNENGEFDFGAVETILRYCEPFVSK